MAVAATLHKAARAAASVVTGKPPEQRRADAQQKLSRLRAQRVEIDANWKAKLHEDPDADVSAFEQSGRAVDR